MRTSGQYFSSVSRSLSEHFRPKHRKPSVGIARRRVPVENAAITESIGKHFCCGRLKESIHWLVLCHWRGEFSGFDFLCSVIKFIAGNGNRIQARQLHAYLTVVGVGNDTFLSNHLISMYGKCGSLDDAYSVFSIIHNKNVHSWNALVSCYCRAGFVSTARRLFDQMPERDSVSWNVMISGYDRHGPCEEALRIFQSMRLSGAVTDHFGVSSALSACCNLRFSINGKLLHGFSVKVGLSLNLHVGSALVELYSKCFFLCEARRVFDTLKIREPFTWNSMLSGYVHCSRIDQALQFFNQMPFRDVVSWTMIIEGCSYHNRNGESVDLFWKMRESGLQADQVAFVCALNACIELLNLEEGSKVHCLAIKCGYETDATVGSVLVSLYAKCGNFSNAIRVTELMPVVDDFSWSVLIAEYAKHSHIERARSLFEITTEKSIALWNALIAGYSDLGMFEEGALAFKEMCLYGWKPDAYTYGSLLTASNACGLRYGEQLHCNITRTGLCSSFFVCGALIDMYFFFNQDKAAEEIFRKIMEPNVVLWNVMILGYDQNYMNCEAMNTFLAMRRSGSKPDNITLSCVLDVCSSTSAQAWGIQVHALSHKTGFERDVIVGSAIVDMYAKCGQLWSATLSFSDIIQPNVFSWTALLGGYVKCGLWDKARALFGQMPEKNIVSWNVMLSGYVQQNCSWDALDLYSLMSRLGIWPNHVSFINILSACSKLLLKDQGRQVHAQIIKTGYHIHAYVGAVIASMYESFELGAINKEAG
ncbi:pentatricopeptide repeat-containing protein At2g13600-like [Wolffia australiana]